MLNDWGMDYSESKFTKILCNDTWSYKLSFFSNRFIFRSERKKMNTFDSSIGDKFCADTFEDAFPDRPLSA